MKIETERFKELLTILKPGLSNKDIIEQATKFVFMENKMITFNDEISIQVELEDLDFSCAVDSEQLYKLVSSLKAKEIKIELEEGELVFKAGRVRAGIVVDTDINLPLEEIDDNEEQWKKLPKNFVEGMKFVVGSCSTDMSSQIITCVNFSGNNVVGTDRYRISLFEYKRDLPFETLIPAKTVKNLIAFKPKFVDKGTGGWIHFKNEEDIILSCRILNDKFPNNDHIFVMGKTKKIELPDSLSEILDRVSIFAEGVTQLDERVNISFKKNKMIIESSSDNGWIRESEKVDYSETEISFSISPYAFKDIVKKNNKMEVGKGKVMFSDKSWKYVAALIPKSE